MSTLPRPCVMIAPPSRSFATSAVTPAPQHTTSNLAIYNTQIVMLYVFQNECHGSKLQKDNEEMFLLERILADGTRLYSKRGNEQKESQQQLWNPTLHSDQAIKAKAY